MFKHITVMFNVEWFERS